MRTTATHLAQLCPWYRAIFAAGFLVSLLVGQAEAFRIVSPADGAILDVRQIGPGRSRSRQRSGFG